MTDDGRRGSLRVYLGAAPGVGKTFAMLAEGRRRLERGTDVVVGLVETHGRARTQALLEDLELVPRRAGTHRGIQLWELDVEAVLARSPAVVLVDELAHTNAPGSPRAKRWQDVEELLAAGIDVVTTVNIQHLESLNDVVESITGIRQQETVPDDVVRRADQIELVDMSPQALRRRLAHGNVYAAEKVDAALANYFRIGNLTALRELALLWVADRVDAALDSYRAEHDIDRAWPARERVVVALTGGPEGEALIRRGARVAERASGGELLTLHVSRSDGLSGAQPAALDRQRSLVEEFGGSFHTVVGDDVAGTVLEFARGVNASQIIIGASRRSRWSWLFSLGTGQQVVQGSGDIDVHVVTHQQAGRRRERLRRGNPLGARRLLAGWILAVLGPPGLVALLGVPAQDPELPLVLLLFLALSVGVAMVGGLWPAIVSAVAAGLLANYFFTPPIYTLTIAEPQNALAIAVQVLVAAAVAAVVNLAARRTAEAAQARAEADTLAALAGSVLRGGDALPALLERIRESVGVQSVALFERSRDQHRSWLLLNAAGTGAPSSPRQADTKLPLAEGRVLALQGPALSASRLRVASAMAAQVDTVLERDRLRAEARTNRRERERTGVRTALLAAVSHDLRTPLAAIKAGVSSLRAEDVVLDPADVGELLADVEASTDRLQSLIDNLLDMSRLDAGVVAPRLERVSVDEIVHRAVTGVPAERLVIDVADSLPLVLVDAGLVERSLANVIENAVRHSSAGLSVLISAGKVRDTITLRVVDRGPGVPDHRKDGIFRAFQRSGDTPRNQGIGLGLAVARGFVEASGGRLDAEDTPGGGLTMTLALPIAAAVGGPAPAATGPADGRIGW